MVLLKGGGVADERAAAARRVRIDVDGAVFALRKDERVLRQRLKLGHLLRRIGLLARKARRRELPLFCIPPTVMQPAKAADAASVVKTIRTALITATSLSPMNGDNEGMDPGF